MQIKKKCFNCKKIFYFFKSRLLYSNVRYCSRNCKNEGRTKQARKIKNCLFCKKIFFTKRGIIKKGGGKYCSLECVLKCPKIMEKRIAKSIFQKGWKSPNKGKKFPERSGQNHPRWVGGKYKGKDGYIYVLNPDKLSKTRYALEHRIVMGNHLGRVLEPWEVVHHVNSVRDDNRIENLELIHKDYDIHFVNITTEMKKEIFRLRSLLDKHEIKH